MKLAFLGGSFNPPHIGHFFLADEVRIALGYDKVLLIPAFVSPFKSDALTASATDRLQMIRLVTDKNPFLVADDRELSRGGISYTYDTVCSLLDEYGSQLEAPPALIIGDDLVEEFSAWKRYDDLVRLTDIIVAHRKQSDPVAFPFPHISLDNALFPVSSSEIRNRIAGQKSWRYLVPQVVYDYITMKRLYGYTV